MEGEQGLHSEALEDAIGDDVVGAAGGLLGGLEDEHDLARPPALLGGEEVGGAEEESSRLMYAEGKIELEDVGGQGGRIMVRWKPGSDLEGKEMEQLVQTLTGMTNAKPAPMVQWPGPQGTTMPTAVMKSPMGTIWFSAMRCGDRRVSVLSSGLKAMGELHRRILPTIRCQPVPEEESKLKVFPWTIELPAGWSLSRSSVSRVTLTDGARSIAVNAGVDPSQREHLAEVLAASYSTSAMKLTFGDWEGDRMAMQGTRGDGAPVVGWVWLLGCPTGGVMVMAIASDAADAAELSTLVTTKGRCLKEGEAAPPWPKRCSRRSRGQTSRGQTSR